MADGKLLSATHGGTYTMPVESELTQEVLGRAVQAGKVGES
jgi:hypothetical protein